MHRTGVHFFYLDDGRCTNSNRGKGGAKLAAPCCLEAEGGNFHGGLPPWSSIGRYEDVDWMLTTGFSRRCGKALKPNFLVGASDNLDLLDKI